ncbi:hypothetical protein SMAC4_13153 [Sordaria macrospora]|uniref:uncharacterized protein n=1 Tax=Sordaria macrospora TaxID=5147 RepID=UPI002B2B95DA|nr:hypothetical protein SMAC4_13153 [Sordaria macrospora]
MGVAAPRKQSREAVVPQQVSDTLPALSQRQTQPSETSYTLSSLAETAITLKATTPFLPTKLLGRLETPTSFSAPAFAATSSSSHSSAVALGIVFGVFFGTIIFSFIIWHFCRRASTPKSSASTWPSSAKAAINTMPVRHSSAMRYPQRPTPVRVRSGDRKERAVPVQEAEKVHKAAKVVKVIQSDDPPPNSRRDSHPVSQGTGQTRHRRDTSAPRLHPGRQAVVDVSSPTTDKWDDHDFHPHERSRHNHEPDDKAASRRRSHQDDSRNPPPVVYVAGRTSHERRSRRSHERESQDAHEHRQTSQTRRRTRRSQPGSLGAVG